MDERYMRDMRGMDGRNPYGSRGGYVTTRRPRRGDRGMDMRGADMRGDMARNQPRTRSGRFRRDYGEDMRHEDMRMNYERDMRRDYPMDGHYQHGRQRAYEPIEFMGYCQGYAGSPDHGDYRGGDYGYDMRGMRDYGYGRRDYGDYGYDYGYPYGDFGEVLSDKELEHWAHKLMSQMDEREKQMFQKDAIVSKAKNMGKPMDGFGEKEIWLTTLMMATDYKNTIGQNPDMYVKLAYDWLSDKDVAVKGAEKLAVYHDCIVMGEDE